MNIDQPPFEDGFSANLLLLSADNNRARSLARWAQTHSRFHFERFFKKWALRQRVWGIVFSSLRGSCSLGLFEMTSRSRPVWGSSFVEPIFVSTLWARRLGVSRKETGFQALSKASRMLFPRDPNERGVLFSFLRRERGCFQGMAKLPGVSSKFLVCFSGVLPAPGINTWANSVDTVSRRADPGRSWQEKCHRCLSLWVNGDPILNQPQVINRAIQK